MKNVNPLKGEARFVSVRMDIRIPQSIKNYMQMLTPVEQAKLNRKNVEISSQYTVKFSKGNLKIQTSVDPIDVYTKRAIEYAVQTNLNSMDPKHRRFVKTHWNGIIYISIKKLVRTGTYQIPWHRDSHYMQAGGIRYKGFCVGAVYVNKPDLPGGNIQFARNAKRFGLAPPSGTSVTFFDDEIFHRVVPVKAPEGVEFVPRSAFFMVFGTEEKGPFKIGISEENIGGERNYEKFYRKLDPRTVLILNKNLSSFTNQNKASMNNAAKKFFKRDNATHVNVKALYNNMKRTLGHGMYQNANIKNLLNKKSPLTESEKTRLNNFAKKYFNSQNAVYSNLKYKYENLKRVFGTSSLRGARQNASFVSLVKPKRVSSVAFKYKSLLRRS
jgi:Fe-S cluster biosynthesis and repair protein YggX